MKELQHVVLARELPEHGLLPGDVGTIIHVYANGGAFEVEFVRGDGKTVAVATLEKDSVRALEGPEILHVRRLGRSNGQGSS